ncbi:hypothetical protein MKW94_022062 [Papaver nudicaule]|uniref:Uncharacterized protein n=1 Tax=Papaver nudicaule TaxID=74823 RepID=A0AA41RTE4_PAPNU|nr:hypothetical protein [Papaver nudicaule]
MNMNRVVVGDKWSMRILWLCAVGSDVGLWMVAVDRQAHNRSRVLAESFEGHGCCR